VVPDKMDALEWLRNHLDAEGSDLLREMVRTFAERLLGAEVEVLCNAGYGEVTAERTNSRNGYRSCQLDTRVGSIDLSIPKLREAAITRAGCSSRGGGGAGTVAVVAECYVRGVSTRRVEGLVQTLGIEHLSKSQVSRMAAELDVEVAAFRSRPLDGGPYTYVSFDAMTQKVREGRRIVNVAVVIAVGVNAEGHREVLGFDVITTEDSFPPIVGEFVRRLRRGLAVAAGGAHIDAAAQLVGGGGGRHPPPRVVAGGADVGRAGAVGDRSAAALGGWRAGAGPRLGANVRPSRGRRFPGPSLAHRGLGVLGEFGEPSL
jgi:transposase-like protein